MAAKKELPKVTFKTPKLWTAWLEEHHATSDGIWMKIAKKGAGVSSITYAQALHVALAWGWIDGQKGKLDDAWWLQKFTRRGPKSIWSAINRDKALALVASGEMMPAGLAAIDLAKKNGRWQTAYEPQSRATVPDDFTAALSANPRATKFFATLDSANRYAILFRLAHAKKPETRAAQISKFVAMLAKHEKLHP
jgi:uncharacterized protein YdeI (YjbR/CyaY-like superfamily)